MPHLLQRRRGRREGRGPPLLPVPVPRLPRTRARPMPQPLARAFQKQRVVLHVQHVPLQIQPRARRVGQAHRGPAALSRGLPLHRLSHRRGHGSSRHVRRVASARAGVRQPRRVLQDTRDP